MSAVLVGEAFGRPGAGAWRRLVGAVVLRWRSVAVLTPLLVLAGVWQGVGMAGAPQRLDDEGTYVAQAYAVQTFHTLAHYTFFYDHPPAGWLQLAAWTWSTDGFGRAANAVLAGREFMLVTQLVSCLLLWVWARRLHLARWSAALAVALFSLSPLAVQFHRSVYLDNIATPWLIAAFLLAASPQRRLSAYAGSALCFAIACLTKETTLLLLPALAWQLHRLGRGTQTRRYGLTVASSVFALTLSFYVVYALAKSELLPGPGHTSLLGGVRFQLLSRRSSGSVLSAGTQGRAHVEQWLQLDHVFPVLALAATVLAYAVPRLRPVALAMSLLLVTLLRPGYLPVPYVIALLPLAALLVAGVADGAVRARTRSRWAAGRRPLAVLATVVGLLSVGLAAPAWAAQQRGLFLAPLDAPVTQAERWVQANVPHSSRLMVDDAFWVDLVRSGYPRANVVWFYKVDTDPDVRRLSPQGWRDYDFILSTESVRSTVGGQPQVDTAIANSRPVAVFGTGQQRVEVRRILPGGAGSIDAQQAKDRQLSRAAGNQLTANPGLTLSPAARSALQTGAVDPRAVLSLGALADSQPITVQRITAEPGESAAGLPARALQIKAADASAVQRFFARQAGPFRPAAAQRLPGGAVQVSWALDLAPTAVGG